MVARLFRRPVSARRNVPARCEHREKLAIATRCRPNLPLSTTNLREPPNSGRLLEFRPLERRRPDEAGLVNAGRFNLMTAESVLHLAEIFCSRQGEGELAGTMSVFVRATGCNLRCWFCDTPYTSWEPQGQMVELAEIVEQIATYDCSHVVLSGGEPLLQPGIVPLSQVLRERGYHITVETAGTIDRPVAADLMSISPKLSNAAPHAENHWDIRHERDRFVPATLQRLVTDYPYQFKFVIDQTPDVDEVRRWLRLFPMVPPDRVWLMPQGRTPEELAQRGIWLEPLAHSLGYHFCPRRHIEWYGNVRGT